jgi:DNA-binding response OmpR family regulator/tetratricopeptide (TPR) repeat protein
VPNRELLLIVEPDPDFGELLRKLLDELGYEPHLVSTHEDALRQLASGGFRLALIDWDVPKGGIALAQKLRASQRELPIALISSSYRAVSDNQMRQLPANMLLSRPMTYYEFVESCAQLIAGKKRSTVPHSSSDIPLSGKLEDFPFEALLFKLFDSQFTGRLSLKRRKANRFIYFLRGFPCAASSNTHSEALGTLLVNRGLVDRRILNEMLATIQKSPLSFGQQLIKAGLITQAQLDTVLDEQVRERVLSCFEFTDGEWEVVPGDGFLHQIEVHIQNPIELLQIGISRFEETNVLAQRVQQRVEHYAVPTRNFARLAPYFPMGENRQSLFSAIDGKKKLGELFKGWRGDLPAFFQVVWAIHAARLIFLSPSPLPTQLPPIENLLAPSRFIKGLYSLRATEKHEGPVALHNSFTRTSSRTFQHPVQELLALDAKLDELNHFEIFGLEASSTPNEIRSAIEQRARLLDPEQVAKLTAEQQQQAMRVATRMRLASKTLLDPDSRERYRQSIEPTASENELERAQYLLDQRQFDELLPCLKDLQAKDPANPRVARLLAAALYHRFGIERRAQIEALLNRAIALDESDAEAHFLLASLQHSLGELSQARGSLERATELDPSHQRARQMLDALKRSDAGLETQPIGLWMLKDH